VEGFTVEPDESNFFQWKVWMEAPKATPLCVPLLADSSCAPPTSCLLARALMIIPVLYVNYSWFSEGGIFELQLTFPQDFPMSPPELRFVSEFWHPNGPPQPDLISSCEFYLHLHIVFADGRVCISILHPPVDDPMSGELPQERWLPTQTVRPLLQSRASLTFY